MKVLIRKLQDCDNTKHPNHIESGFEIEVETRYPKPITSERYPPDYYWSTSVVTKILDDNTFQTLNSIYQYTILN